ncbi:P-loop containing nucleoside triphosphate hydrolase protein [Aspergillus floccosus]
MTNPQNNESMEIDKDLLQSIDARRKACNAKEALACSRLAFQAANGNPPPGAPTTNAAELSTPPTGESSSAAPADPTGGGIDPDSNFLEWGSSQAAASAQKPAEQTEVDDNDPSQWPDEIPMDKENDEQRFADIKFDFECILQPTMAEQIRFEREKQKEEARKKRVASRMALEEKETEQEQERENEQDALFCEPDQACPAADGQNPPQGDESEKPQEPQDKKPEKPMAKGQNRINAAERRRSKKLGLDIVLGNEKQKGKKRGKKRKTDCAKGGSSKKQKKEEVTDTNLRDLLHSDVVWEAHASSSMQTCPGFTQKDKSKALTELIASIPTADQDDAKSDMKKILEATVKFNNKARSDGSGGWKVKGLKTSLYHYQLLGAAFMRDRENVDHAPFGANMVDGRPLDENDPVKTTLIVVPSQLVTHWVTQITKHCDKGAIGKIAQYHAKSRIISTTPADTAQLLQDMGVIITTYEEVRRSYPQMKIPKTTTDPAQVAEWWDALYEQEIGPLHRIKFLRIILDEGHHIKSHTSSVSIAVRALTAKYKWVLTGTPVLNYPEELYAQFDFLGVPHIGSFDTFSKNYCIGKLSQKRLTNLLRSFMFRRTHSSRLFSLPIISLPDIKEHVAEVELCAAERKLYDAIKDVFINNINGLSSVRNPKMAQYRCFFTMIMMLRMFSSHTLTAQSIVKKLLTPELLKQLSEVSRNDTTSNRPSTKIANLLSILNGNGKGKFPIPSDPPQGEGAQESLDELHGDKDELVKNFRAFMNVLHEEEQWEECLQRTHCVNCRLTPDSPVLTDCKHIYCAECYHMLEQKAVDGAMKRVCQKKCREVIDTAAMLDTLEDIPSEAGMPTNKDPGKRKTQEQKKKKKKLDDSEDTEMEVDWISECGCTMPSAKLSKITEIVSGWIHTDRHVKVVLFTQFLGFTRILEEMCQKQGWLSASLTGTMSVSAREKSLKVFREDPKVRVLVASLKVGGVGLDMSMASKCIIVDLWWNEGIQQQAFCRLLRIGQKNTVEVIKLIAKETIDDYMHRLQTEKTQEITETLGEDVLAQRDDVVRLIEMFAEVTQVESGGFTIQSRKQ